MKINLALRNGSKILRNKFVSSFQLDSEILMAQGGIQTEGAHAGRLEWQYMKK